MAEGAPVKLDVQGWAAGLAAKIAESVQAAPAVEGYRAKEELYWASRRGDTAKALGFLQKGYSPNDEEEINISGAAPLMSAASNGHVETVMLLVEHGAALDYSDPDDGKTALMHAVIGNKADVVAVLLAAGADAALQSKDGETAKELAIKYKEDEIAALF